MILYYRNFNCALLMLFLDLFNITTQETLIGSDVTRSIIGIQHGIGRRMCERECLLRQNECKSITYDSEHFVCRLHGSPSSPGWSLNDNYRTVNASEFSQAISGKCADVECLTAEKCVEVGNSTKCVQIGFPRDCKDIYQFFSKESGMYITYPFLPNATKTISVCEMDHAEGGYTMVQRRLDGSINFTRNWIEYENGFGNLESDFWIGNTVLHTLTSMGSTLLHIKLQGHNDNWKYAEYSTFSVADSTDNYRMSFTGYSGTAGNSIDNCNDAQFTTYDKDHDTHSTNCALIRGQGGWWFKSCCRSNLNGVYCTSGENNAEKCNRWYYFSNNNVGMKTSLMLIRRND